MVATSFQAASASAVPTLVPQAPDVAADQGTVRLFPTQMRFVTGVARAYEDDFPPELSHVVKKQDFETAINQINNTMKDYWPCFFCVCCGYSCCVCTLGLSLLCPNMCIKDAEQYVRSLIARINRRHCFTSAGVEWRLMRKCGRSWIEITYPLTKGGGHTVATYQGSALEGTITRPAFSNGSTSPRAPRSATSSSRLVLEV